MAAAPWLQRVCNLQLRDLKDPDLSTVDEAASQPANQAIATHDPVVTWRAGMGWLARSLAVTESGTGPISVTEGPDGEVKV